MSANIPFAATSAIPRAPPLPAPRPLQRARDAANKFFGYQLSRPASPVTSSGDDNLSRGGSSLYASLGAGDATASHRTGLEINTIALNEQGTHALLGGKEIFKTIKVEDGFCTEELNLRSAIRSNPRTASGKTRQIYTIDIADVAWARGDCGNFVAAATSSGKIILYDLGHAGLQAAQLHEHFRQVHKITFNPHRGNLLLSGSQDGTVRLWDVRESRQASTLQSKRKFSGLDDGVRDVKWSPTEGVEFVVGTDSGWVQCWDMRNLKAAKVKISAHTAACNAVDWHPDGKHIASASSDSTVRVWDMTNPKRQKSDWIIRTPYPVFNARWRPSCESSFNKDPNARQCTQLVTGYDPRHPLLHIWDYRRPALPFREMSPYPTAATDLIWHSQDLLWTVGREGVFLQNDIQHASKAIDKRNLQCFAVSPQGEVNSFARKRSHSHPLKRLPTPHFSVRPSGSFSSSPEGPYFERSWRDDSLDHSFLTVGSGREHELLAAKRRTSSISTGIGSEQQPPTIKLDSILRNRKSFRPDQASVRGLLPVLNDPRLFSFFSRQYKLDLDEALQADDFLASLEKLLLHNAASARCVSLYRLAQTWEIVRVVLFKHLAERAQSNSRATKDKKTLKAGRRQEKLSIVARRMLRETTKTPSQTPASMQPISGIVAHHLHVPESTSNAPTPLARPVRNGKSQHGRSLLPDPDKESLTLPPLLDSSDYATRRTNGSRLHNEPKLTATNLNGNQYTQLRSTSKADMVRRWSIQPKEPLNLEMHDSDRADAKFPRLEKQDSNESFNFLDPSTDSQGVSFTSSAGSDNSGGPVKMVSERPSRPFTPAATEVSPDSEAPDHGNGRQATAAVPIPGSVAPVQRRDHRDGLRDGLDNEDCAMVYRDDIVKTISRTEAALGPDGPDSYPDENGIVNYFEPSNPNRSPPRETLAEPSTQTVVSAPRSWGVPEENTSAAALPPRLGDKNEHHHSASAYLPKNDDVDLEVGKPFGISSMLEELLTYYASHADVQTASSLALLLISLLPRTASQDATRVASTVSSYVDAFASVGFAPTETTEFLDEELDHTVRTGLQLLQIESILSTYHDQLMKVKLWNEAVELRRLAYPSYPSVYEDALKENTISLHCSTCGEIISKKTPARHCEQCINQQDDCPVCWSSTSPYEQEVSTPSIMRPLASLFTACLLCGHSGHAACLRMWFIESGVDDGGCPTTGCLCDCASGSWRQEKIEIMDMQRRLRSLEKVKQDEWAARESKAVERTREMLGKRAGNDPRAGRLSA